MKANFEYRINDFLAGFLPWLVPIPSAFVIGRATVHHLEFPLWAAFVTALAIEGMAFFTSSTALMLYEYNQTKTKSNPAAPVRLGAIMVLSYVFVTVLLTVALDVAPVLGAYANTIFPLLSLTAMVTAALRYQHKGRLLSIEADKENRKAERQARRQTERTKTDKELSNNGQNLGYLTDQVDRMNQARLEKFDTRIDTLLDIYRNDPGASPTDVSRKIGVSRQTVYNYLAKLEDEGRIHRNGKGVEVFAAQNGHTQDKVKSTTTR